MDALIQQHEEEKYHFSGFWKKLTTPQEEMDKGFTGRLRIQTKSRGVKSVLCRLTPEFLYICHVSYTQETTGAPVKLAPVTWKRVDPFSEENGAVTRYGFSLSRGKNNCDFYTESQEELETWLDRLSSVAVMSDLSNDFEVREELGKGNHAAVYRGRSTHDGSQVAIKTISKERIMQNSRSLQALFNEVGVMKHISHPRITKLIGIYESNTELHLVLEYVSGGDLFQQFAVKGKYSEAQTLIFMNRLLGTLEYMHGRGVVHRDLKPENILLVEGSDGLEFKIADFGLASGYHIGDAMTLRCGSPGYVAPEILEKQPYDSKVDIFSAGVIMYILYAITSLSGRSPFSAVDLNEILVKNRHCKIYFPQKHWQNVSAEAINVVTMLTEKNPRRRPCATDALAHVWFSGNPRSAEKITHARTNTVTISLK